MIQQRKRCTVVKPTEETIWEEYIENVSIHGLRYAVQKKAKPWERSVWVVLLAIAGIVILQQLYRSWKMYTHTLTNIVIEDPRYPLSEIDFPAITVCSNNNIMYSKAKALTDDSERNPPLIGSDGELVPLRNNAAGKMSGIELVLRNMEDEHFPKDRKLKGYNIMVHTPDEFPDETVSYTVQVDINKVSQISVSVSKVCADQSLYWVKIEDQKCSMYYSNLTNSQQSSLFCKSPSEGTCFRKLRQRNVQAPETERAAFPEWSLPAFMNCSCPTPCSFTSYTTENRMITMYTVSNMTLGPDHMYLDIHYKDPYAISYSRSIKYSTEDLMVTFGGMASLFLGCSLVTLVEAIYFVYRLLVTLKRRCSTVDVIQLQNNNVNYPFCP
ncbi:pickpocket protein 11-like [Adelges cooleyi]|uniref:pickpocket protein 11-like n=1 Tax=Adelges cooleyi TaxID=133065 RepID=UPI0021803D37|nr:pickpocket protein 11-like [Adelges cooleyi]